MGRQTMLALRRAYEGARVPLDFSFAPQKPTEAAERGQLSSRGRARIATLVQVAEKSPDVQVLEVGNRDVNATAAEVLRQERDELLEIAFVRSDGVHRRVFVEMEMLEKVADVLLH